MNAHLLLTLALLSTSCTSKPKTMVVPGPGFTQSLAARASRAEAKVSTWVELSAERRTGPWVEVPYRELAAGECGWVRPPPPIETDVQANVRWLVSPEGVAEFNLPTGPEDLHQRRVRFSRPGTYRVVAESAGCNGPFRSAEVVVIVLP